MESFKKKLDNLIKDGITKIHKLIDEYGRDSDHTNYKCLKVIDNQFTFKLGDNKYLSEINKYNLVDNTGYSYNYGVLDTQDLMRLIDYYMKNRNYYYSFN